MKDTIGLDEEHVAERQRQQAAYDEALASIRQKRVKREASGYATMAAVSAYGEAAHGEGWFGMTSRFARHVCITFAIAAPVAFFIRDVM